MTPPEAFQSLAAGVAAGLASALLSAVSFLVSRHHGGRGDGAALRLLVLAHGLMGAVCLPLAWLLVPARAAPVSGWGPPLAGSACTYIAGQSLVFAALRRTDASRIAPLLGLKIAMLAAVSALVPLAPLDTRQWVAVALSILAAALLQRGGAIPRAALGIVLAACVTFATSDLCIVRLIDEVQRSALADGRPLGRLHAGILAMALTYVVCGTTAALVLAAGAGRPRERRDWIGAAQYAAAWLVGMGALYVCFGLVGVVFGNILQSTRGVMSIVIGAALAHAGWHDLETRVDGRTLARRVVAAVLMTAAIALYVVDLA